MHKIELTGKIYSLEFLSGMVFYSLGIMLITPPTDPPMFKYICIGAGIALIILIVAFIALRKSELADERAILNYHRASTMTLGVLFLFVLIWLVLAFGFSITFFRQGAMVSFLFAIIFICHAFCFFTLEKKGV